MATCHYECIGSFSSLLELEKIFHIENIHVCHFVIIKIAGSRESFLAFLHWQGMFKIDPWSYRVFLFCSLDIGIPSVAKLTSYLTLAGDTECVVYLYLFVRITLHTRVFCFYLKCPKHFLQIVLSFLMVKQKEIQSYRVFQCILLFPHSTLNSVY